MVPVRARWLSVNVTSSLCSRTRTERDPAASVRRLRRERQLTETVPFSTAASVARTRNRLPLIVAASLVWIFAPCPPLRAG